MANQKHTMYGARVFIIVILIFIAALLMAFGKNLTGTFNTLQPVPNSQSLTPAASLFVETVEQHTLTVLGGIPIEGLEPSMVLSAYPGMFASDFDGVESSGGKYVLTAGELVFVADQNKPQTSASGSLTAYSFGQLLENIARRFSMPLTTEEEVRAILHQLTMVSQSVSMEGTFVCLHHRPEFSGPTEECAFGLKGDDGKYYALDTQALSGNGLEGTASGDVVTVDGILTPIEMLSTNFWQKYDIIGIISVTQFSKVRTGVIERI